ncbi:methionyl-tRNA formyltransferase [Streptomonospora litoralis]|uniref:Methionyl-tRNA formyltransferase n=1 Tax=Streptomonospora litoralis TaxID=2498135 RepID=A0A4P6PZP2_9ACTN|nr:methionyl-tRNA formyltransferase [Streptomonospora litoralis]QBI53623.1 Methionyl-tRNA formyltransferase [Streptomonospora litoralis]
MRVAIIGQAAFGEAVLRRLQDDGVTVAGVAAPEPAQGGRVDRLWSASEEAGIPRVSTASLKEPGGLVKWKELEADFCLMAFVTHFLPDDVFTLPTHGTAQYHPSLLPLHRGKSAINWALINGEQETGLSIFWPDRGIDTGPVLLQKRCPIGPDDTVGSLYFDRLFPLGVDAVSEAVALVAAGEAPRIEQDHAEATFEPGCSDRHVEIHWHRPARVVYDLIRGADPRPGAWTLFEEEKLRFFDCRLTGERRPGRPGEVLDVDDSGFAVRLNGDVLRVGRVQHSGTGKLPAGQWAAQAGPAPGFRFR